jgi:hypothetical protein
MTSADRFTWAAVAAVVLIGIAVFAALEASRRAAIAARAVAEPWRESPDWRGTIIFSELTIPPQVREAFTDDPPAPEERKAMVARFPPWFARHRLLGWKTTLDAITPNAQGWEVDVQVGVKMGFTAFTPSHTVETWQISKGGKAQFVKCSGTHGGILVVD